VVEIDGNQRPSEAARSLARDLEARGEGGAARRAHELADRLGEWEAGVVRRAGAALAAHHDIRNALTGVLGNAQLLLMGPAAEVPGARRRLESLTREAERIRDLAERLGRARLELNAMLETPDRTGRPGAGTEAA
jgi:signal transduction histidine kinase